MAELKTPLATIQGKIDALASNTAFSAWKSGNEIHMAPFDPNPFIVKGWTIQGLTAQIIARHCSQTGNAYQDQNSASFKKN